MQLGIFFACTAPVTAFLFFHQYASMMRSTKRKKEFSKSNAITAFTLLYIIGTMLLLIMK
jgi:hypothetical protein